MKYCVLYNPYSGNRHGEEYARNLDNLLKDELVYYNMDLIRDFKKFLKEHHEPIIICGGDGTINHFVNCTKGIKYKNEILYYSTGTGNDFYNDVGDHNHFPMNIEKYLQNLPVTHIKDKDYYFINGIGMGLDGYCCEVGDQIKLKSSKPISYTKIAAKALLYQFKPVKAQVIVDDQEYYFDDVWMVTTMNGRYLGGGMFLAPMQERLGENRKLSVVVFHNKSKIKTMLAFSLVFSGKHINKKDVITVIHGTKIKVVFDRKSSIQIDGEVKSDVNEYEVSI